MGLKARIQKQVRYAFGAVGDLAKPITLLQKNTTEYNFGTELPVATTLTTTLTKCIELQQKREKGTENPSIVKKVLLSAEDISDPDIYDKVVIDGVTWNIVAPYDNDGFLITLSLTKEA